MDLTFFFWFLPRIVKHKAVVSQDRVVRAPAKDECADRAKPTRPALCLQVVNRFSYSGTAAGF